MKERAQELKADARRGSAKKGKADGEADVLAKIAAMPDPDRARPCGSTRPSKPAPRPSRRKPGMGCLRMPGTARSSAFQSAQKFETRYATFGFSDTANLDEGAMWLTSFALKELTAAEAARIVALVKKT
jgi:hypothetical protein